MESKKIWVFGKNTVFSILSLQKRKVHEIHILNKNFYNLIDSTYHSICKLVSEKKFLQNLKAEIAHQGIGAYVDTKPINKINDIQGNTIILDNVYDHRNIGSIIRTAVAFGIYNIVIEKRNFSLSSQLMYKTASGAMENINFFEVTNIANTLTRLKEKNYTILSFDGNSTSNAYMNEHLFLNEKISFVFGSEDKGIRELVKKNSNYILKIPILTIESLNISSAVSSVLTLHHYLTNKKKKI